MFLPFALLNGERGAAGPASTPGHTGQEEQEQEQDGGSSPSHRPRRSHSTRRAPPRDRDATRSRPQELSGLVPGST